MWFHWIHKWKCVKVYHYNDTSYTTKEKNIGGYPSTAATYICTICNKAKVENYFGSGYLTIKELNQTNNE